MVSLVVFNGFLALSPTLDAGSYPFVFQRFSELVSVMASILEQPFAFWQTSQQGPCPDVVADLSGGDEKVQCPPLAVSDGVQLSIHTVCDLANHMSTRPFLLPCWSLLGVPRDTLRRSSRPSLHSYRPPVQPSSGRFCLCCSTASICCGALYGPYSMRVSCQRKPLRLMNIMPLNTRFIIDLGLAM